MNDKITFPRLAAMLADRSGRSKRFSEDFLREFFALISEGLEAGESVKVRGLGTFRLSRVEPRMSVDVTTGQPMEIAGHSKVVFVPSKELAEAVNAPFEAFSAIEIGDDVDISQLFPDDETAIHTDPEPLSAIPDFEEESEGQDDQETEMATAESIISFLIPEDAPTRRSLRRDDDMGFDIASANASSPSAMRDNQVGDQKRETSDLTVDFSDELTDMTVEPDPEPMESAAQSKPSSSEARTEETPSTVDFAATSTIRTEERKIPVKDEPDTYEGLAAASFSVQMPEAEPQSDDNEDIESAKPTVVPATAAESLPSDSSKETLNSPEPISEATVAIPTSPDSPDLPAVDDAEEGIGNDEEPISEERGKSRHRVAMISLAAVLIGLLGICAVWYVYTKYTEDPTSTETEQTVAAIPEVLPDTVPETDAEEVPTAPSDAIVYDTISTTRYLTTMAKAHYGNYNLWPYIYEENKAILGHPDRIRPGTPIVIPDLRKYGVDPANATDIEKAKKMGTEIYSRYGKKI